MGQPVTETSSTPEADGFSGAVRAILTVHLGEVPATVRERVTRQVTDTYASRISHERRRADRAAAETKVLVDRDQAKDLILAEVRKTAGQLVVGNARASAHITHLAGQVEAIRQMLDTSKDTLSAVDVHDVLMERQFRGVPDGAMVVGFAPSREYSMGAFSREFSELPVHFAFAGWSLVCSSTFRLPMSSLLEATFQVDGALLPTSALAARGLRLETLLP